MTEKIESLIDPNDIEIINDLVYAFPYPTFEFTIEYSTNNKEWCAYHYDEDAWEERIILENADMKFDGDILLFNVYTLTIKEFDELKDFVAKDIE